MGASQEPRRRRPPGPRGQSSTVGLVLVFGMVVAASAMIVAFGAAAVTDTQHTLSDQRAEKVLTQLDSKAALVALGNAEAQQVSLPRSGSDRYNVTAGAGWMNVSVDEASGGDTEVFNRSLGSIVYRDGDTVIAYQGGGVWRSSGGDSGVMVSPPEFHYRGRTLTLPHISIEGEGSLSARAVVTHDETIKHFPNASVSGFSNPVEGDAMNLTIHSEYYRAWGSYFATRTQGAVTYDDAARTAKIRLVPPFDEDYDNAVATTDPNGITMHPPGSPPSPFEEGTNYPIVDARIEEQIDDCQTSGCNAIPAGDTIGSAGTFFVNGDYAPSTLTVDDPGGNVTLVVNGDFEPQTVEFTDVSRPHTVTVYVRNDFAVGGGTFNGVDGDPYESTVMMHSDGSVDWNGATRFVGLLYAPQSSCDQNGGGSVDPNIIGGVVCESLDMNGDPTDIQYDAAINALRLDLTADDITQLQYLHVTTNVIEIAGD